MKKFLIFISLCLLGLASPLLADRQLLDQVVAVVNDEPVTQSELDFMMRPVYEEYKQQFKGEAFAQAITEVRRKLLNQLIEDKLVYQEAKNQKIEADISEVETQLASFRKKFKTDAELEDALGKEGFTLKEMRERLERQSIIRHIQDMEVRGKVVVSPLEVEDYYQNHQDEFSSEGTLRASTITIKKSDEAREKGLTDEEARTKLQGIRKKILSGQDFAAMAREFSQDTSAKEGGITGWIQRGEMIPEIDTILFSLTPGQVSEIIETPMGYHIFRVEERKEKYKKTFEESRDLIYEKIYREKTMKRFQEWIDGLKRTAYISIR